MTEVLLEAKGVNGQLALLEGRVRLSKKGVLGFLTQGLKGDKEIAISSISSVQWKRASGLTNGYIQFSFQGGAEAKGGLLQATKDENTIMFRKGQQPSFEAIRDEVQRRMASGTGAGATSSSSTADELKKLAELRDQGVITSAEFDTQKKKLLGM